MTASIAADQIPELSLKQLRELRKSEDLLYVRNNTHTLITCNRNVRDSSPFHIEPAGQSGSIQILPKEVLDLPRFQKLWMKRAVTVSNDERMETAIQLLMSGELHLTQERHDEIMGMIDESSTSRALKEMRCLSCDGRIFMPIGDVESGAIPLCDMHVSEAPNYSVVPQADGSFSYTRVQVTAPVSSATIGVPQAAPVSAEYQPEQEKPRIIPQSQQHTL
jgi:hypothetical protein